MTQTRAKSNQNRFSLDFLLKNVLQLPSVTRSNFRFPSDHHVLSVQQVKTKIKKTKVLQSKTLKLFQSDLVFYSLYSCTKLLLLFLCFFFLEISTNFLLFLRERHAVCIPFPFHFVIFKYFLRTLDNSNFFYFPCMLESSSVAKFSN